MGKSSDDTSLFCIACGKPVMADAQFCGECGAPVTADTEHPDAQPSLSCAVCGKKLEGDSRFCDGCGTTVSVTGPQGRGPRCSACGKELEGDAQFCDGCGKALQPAMQPPAQPAMQPPAQPSVLPPATPSNGAGSREKEAAKPRPAAVPVFIAAGVLAILYFIVAPHIKIFKPRPSPGAVSSSAEPSPSESSWPLPDVTETPGDEVTGTPGNEVTATPGGDSTGEPPPPDSADATEYHPAIDVVEKNFRAIQNKNYQELLELRAAAVKSGKTAQYYENIYKNNMSVDLLEKGVQVLGESEARVNIVARFTDEVKGAEVTEDYEGWFLLVKEDGEWRISDNHLELVKDSAP
ncbi:MAG: zinc ribbon domain-containing protein [Candidatus Eremiobacteraeota bacterium]|nr:zinc ribbon domain-containing protein [Candidatus Eremiobacteraeota bacterium]